MSHWQQRGPRWAIEHLSDRRLVSLVGSKHCGPCLFTSRAGAREAAKEAGLRDVRVVKVRVSYEEIK